MAQPTKKARTSGPRLRSSPLERQKFYITRRNESSQSRDELKEPSGITSKVFWGMLENLSNLRSSCNNITEFVFKSFREATLSASNTRIQNMLQANAASIDNLSELLLKAQKLTFSELVSKTAPVHGTQLTDFNSHLMGFVCGSFTVAPAWKGQLKVLFPREDNVDYFKIGFCDYTMPPLNLSQIDMESTEPDLELLKVLRNEFLEFEASTLFAVTFPFSDIKGISIARLHFNMVVMVFELLTPPTIKTRRVQCDEQKRNMWRRRSDFSSNSQLTTVSRLYLTVLENEVPAILKAYPMISPDHIPDIVDWNVFSASPYASPASPVVSTHTAWKPLCPISLNQNEFPKEQSEELIKLDECLLYGNGACDPVDGDDSESDVPDWTVPEMDPKELKRVQLLTSVRDVLNHSVSGDGDCTIC